MVRKVISIILCVVLFCAFSTTALAESFTAYEGNPSSTYITYFKDIVSGIGFNENYVAFRSGQNEYVMIVGQLNYENNNFSLEETGTLYKMSTDGNYNSYYKYTVDNIDSLSFNPQDKIIYSDIGDFPQLVERGAKYEQLQTLLLCIAFLYIVISKFFR